MSYEGYEQHICREGHYYTCDASFDASRGCDCGAPTAWYNAVDETNCDSCGEIPYDLLAKHFRIATATFSTCGACSHTKALTTDIFRIPTYEETEVLRHWRPGYGGTPLVPLVDSADESSDLCETIPDAEDVE